MQMHQTQPAWHPLSKHLFRFWGTYFIIYFYLSSFSFLWLPLVKWIAPLMGIHDEIAVNHNGSGDGLYYYIQLPAMLLVTLMISIVWAVIDRKRKSYNRALYWVWVAVRCVLGYYMLIYGFAKVFVSQFPAPTLHRLVQPYGMSSPMGLAWTFMGASPGFTIFTGFAEALGGTLLLFRQTVKAGALLSAAVLTVVVAMNFGYDIPVKIFSVHLLLAAVFIISPELPRLLLYLFTTGVVPASTMYLHTFKKTGPRIAWTAAKIIVVLAVMVIIILQERDNRNWYAENGEQPPLYGVYTAELVTHNNDTIPAQLTDSTRWHYFIVQYNNRATVRYMNESYTYYTMQVDTTGGKVTITDVNNDKDTISMNYEEYDDMLVMSSYRENDTTRTYLRRRDRKDFLLTNRGFHWVNEYPYNR